MSGSALPPALRPFLEFARRLREAGFPAAPEQTTGFLAAVELLGPRGIDDLRRAAVALFGPPPERMAEFEAIFQLVFAGRRLVPPTAERRDEELSVLLEREGLLEIAELEEGERSGRAATRTERLRRRDFGTLAGEGLLRELRRRGGERLPKRRSRRRRSARRGPTIDFRGSLRRAMREEGELLDLRFLRRRRIPRRLLLLVDVSGSMKAQSPDALRFAHALRRLVPGAEVFTLGTRLTRVTRSLAGRDPRRALERTAERVSDWDGGTRLGDALAAFLRHPRLAGLARDAWVLVVSDGLERGDPGPLIDGVRRLSRLAWRLSWLTPLAADPAYRPETGAMRALGAFLDDLADGGSLASLCRFVLRGRAGVPE